MVWHLSRVLEFIGEQAVLGLLPRLWKWARMRIIPFVSKKKPVWCIKDNLDRIQHAIDEDDPTHFCLEVKNLYPMLKRYGVAMPEIEPVITGILEYDTTWHEYHLHFLKFLHREIRNNSFDLESWNNQILTNERYRHQILTKQRRYATPSEAERDEDSE